MIFRDGQPGPNRGGPELLGLSATYRLFKAASNPPRLPRRERRQVMARDLSGPLGHALRAAHRRTGDLRRPDLRDRRGAGPGVRDTPRGRMVGSPIDAGIPCVPASTSTTPTTTPNSNCSTSPQIAANDLVASHQHPVFVHRPTAGTVRAFRREARSLLGARPPSSGNTTRRSPGPLEYDDARIAALREKGVLAGGDETTQPPAHTGRILADDRAVRGREIRRRGRPRRARADGLRPHMGRRALLLRLTDDEPAQRPGLHGRSHPSGHARHHPSDRRSSTPTSSRSGPPTSTSSPAGA